MILSFDRPVSGEPRYQRRGQLGQSWPSVRKISSINTQRNLMWIIKTGERKVLSRTICAIILWASERTCFKSQPPNCFKKNLKRSILTSWHSQLYFHVLKIPLPLITCPTPRLMIYKVKLRWLDSPQNVISESSTSKDELWSSVTVEITVLPSKSPEGKRVWAHAVRKKPSHCWRWIHIVIRAVFICI